MRGQRRERQSRVGRQAGARALAGVEEFRARQRDEEDRQVSHEHREGVDEGEQVGVGPVAEGAARQEVRLDVADAALDATDPHAPPAGIVRLHRALGDDTRLRILRLLRDRDLYLTEIAQLLELSKPTIKHHLVLLRSAGLVTVTEEAGLTYYSLRRDRLDDAAGEIKRFLLG